MACGLRIALIGMSNVGKSYWAERLEDEKEFVRICVDDLIEAKLGQDPSFTPHGIEGVASWMGQPDSSTYDARSKRYLECEEQALREIIDSLSSGDFEDASVVVDTTGSVVYLSTEILQDLRKLLKMVYLKPSPARLSSLVEAYRAVPKPVYWGTCYSPKPGEKTEETLVRCYPDLLYKRSLLYSRLADVVVDLSLLEGQTASTEQFLKIIHGGCNGQ